MKTNTWTFETDEDNFGAVDSVRKDCLIDREAKLCDKLNGVYRVSFLGDSISRDNERVCVIPSDDVQPERLWAACIPVAQSSAGI